MEGAVPHQKLQGKAEPSNTLTALHTLVFETVVDFTADNALG